MILRTTTLATALVAALGAPALAHTDQKVNIPPGSSHNWVQQQPTRYFNVDVAQVLPDGLAYISAGTAAGPAGLNYARGMGNGAELGFGLQSAFAIGGAFTGGLFANWKQQLARAENLAIAVEPGVGLNLGAATTLGAGVGLPFTLDAGAGHVTIEPRLQIANLSAAGTSGIGDVAVGYQTPLADRWSVLAEVDPTFTFAGNAFSLPLRVGARFSPTATAHVDFTFADLNATPTFGGSVGLVGLTGHVGF